MGRGSGRVLLLALALFLTLHTPASAVPKGYCVFFDDLASSSSLLNGLTLEFTILYRLDSIGVIGLLIDDSLVAGLLKLSGVLFVIPDTLYKPQTTHSWEFLGLESGGKANPEWEQTTEYGQGVTIANVDTGVSPTSASFRDDGLAAPWRWRHRAACNAGKDPTFQCNKKLIGARFFSKGVQVESLHHGNFSRLNHTDLNSPRDYDGHGSHTLSTAGGGFVGGASAFGHGTGTAKGGSPLARVASYKACFLPNTCSGIDILAAIVTAVDDGVDVLSLSLGEPPAHYITGLMELGALYAVRNGVVVVASAGNEGPDPGSVTNVAPWMFTVGASTMDRDFPAQVTFRVTTTTTKTIKGRSLSDSTVPAGREHPMISGEKASATRQSTNNSTLCLPGSLDQVKVKGKIVVCTRGVNGRTEKGQVVKEAGGIGMVLCNDESTGNSTVADPHVIPTAHCSFSQCKDLLTYLQSEPSPVGYIQAMDAQLGVKPAPVMAGFSSRGPNTITPQILKPDITAPGVGVIAAYGELEASATGMPSYNILSGTSMSCPHVAGIAGLLKTKYPEWSPAMIKSAIMTTADNYSQIQEETGAAATPFGYGAGHVNPLKSLDPGLVYDTRPDEYASFLCSTSSKPTQAQTVASILGLAAGGGLLRLPIPLFSRLLSLLLGISPFQCSSGFRPEDLNYPSIAVVCLSPGTPITVKRRVMNVLDATTTSKYTVAVVQPAGIKVTVDPPTLSFGEIYEEREFSVKMEVSDAAAAADYVFGSIEWSDSDGKHRVRSPVAATTKCA